MRLKIYNGYTEVSRMKNRSFRLIQISNRRRLHKHKQRELRVLLITDNLDKIPELTEFRRALLGYPMITMSAHYMV